MRKRSDPGPVAPLRRALRLTLPAGPARLRCMTIVPVLLLLLTALTAPSAADVMAYVPADSMVVVAGRPPADRAPTSASASQPDPQLLIQQLLMIAGQLKLLPPQARVIGDIAASLPLLGRYPYAFTLLDITARPLPKGGHRLAQMQAAIVFDVGDDHTLIVQRIRQLLATYTNAELSRLEQLPSDEGTRYRLVDSRLPEWAVLEWGPLGRQFMVSIGEGAFDRMLAVRRGAVPAMAGDSWYVSACRLARIQGAFIECVLAATRLRLRLDEAVKGRPAEVLHAIGADKLDRGLLIVSADPRVVRAHAILSIEGFDHDIVLSEVPPPGDPAAAAIPPQAHRYGFLCHPVADLIRGLCGGYLASQGEATAGVYRDGWAKIETEYGFNAERDWYAHLGNRLIVHDYPRHPLHVPLLWTFLIETDGAETDVRRALDAMMAAARAGLARRAAEDPGTGIAPQIRQTKDGIWFVQLGLAGPAVTVTGRWIVLSFSPEAVRENLPFLRSAPATATAPRVDR
jgi:hypothetical protein